MGKDKSKKAMKADKKATKVDKKSMKADKKAMKADKKAMKADKKAMKVDKKAMKADKKAMKADKKSEPTVDRKVLQQMEKLYQFAASIGFSETCKSVVCFVSSSGADMPTVEVLAYDIYKMQEPTNEKIRKLKSWLESKGYSDVLAGLDSDLAKHSVDLTPLADRLRSERVEHAKKICLGSNDYWATNNDEDWGAQAAGELMKVRGENFRKEKNKKKRAGWQGAGTISFVSRSIKFD